MNSPAHKFKKLVKQRAVSPKDVALSVGITLPSLRNVLCGNSASRSARQKITNVLGKRIWLSVGVTERYVTLPISAEIELDTEAEAISAERDFVGFVNRTGRKITFIKSARVVVGRPSIVSPSVTVS